MSEHMSRLLRGLLSRNSSKPQPQTQAEKIRELERIKDPDVRARAIDWQLKRQKFVDVIALCLLIAVTIAGLCVVLGTFPVGITAAFTSLLITMGGALIKFVLNS